MIRGEGMMIARVPVLGQNHMAKDAGDPIDHRHHLLAARHGKSASIAEVILYIDHQQNVAVKEFDAHFLFFHLRPGAPSFAFFAKGGIPRISIPTVAYPTLCKKRKGWGTRLFVVLPAVPNTNH
jgi:hypothetical protein